MKAIESDYIETAGWRRSTKPYRVGAFIRRDDGESRLLNHLAETRTEMTVREVAASRILDTVFWRNGSTIEPTNAQKKRASDVLADLWLDGLVEAYPRAARSGGAIFRFISDRYK